MCEITTAYTIQLTSSNGIKSIKTLTTQNCIDKLCSVKFSSGLDKTAESYNILVMAISQQINQTFTSFSTISKTIIISDHILNTLHFIFHFAENTTGNFIINSMCNNLVSITCSTSVNKNCIVKAMTMNSTANVMPGETYNLNLDMIHQDIEIIIHINSTIIVQRFGSK